MKLHEQGMKVMERVLNKRFCRVGTVNEMQFGFMADRGTMDAVLIIRKLQEKYHAYGKMLCFVDL